jgi:hypothetical protein
VIQIFKPQGEFKVSPTSKQAGKDYNLIYFNLTTPRQRHLDRLGRSVSLVYAMREFSDIEE